MSTVKEDLLSLKDVSLKLNDNFKNVLRKHELSSRSTKEKVFRALVDNLNEYIDNVISETDDGNGTGMLEKFINNPGLQHLAENIFLNLKYRDLEACRLLNGTMEFSCTCTIRVNWFSLWLVG